MHDAHPCRTSGILADGQNSTISRDARSLRLSSFANAGFDIVAVEIDEERVVPAAPADFGGAIVCRTASKSLGVESIHGFARRRAEAI
jgi:hypothetical protein